MRLQNATLKREHQIESGSTFADTDQTKERPALLVTAHWNVAGIFGMHCADTVAPADFALCHLGSICAGPLLYDLRPLLSQCESTKR